MSLRKSNTYDNLLLLKDAGAVTASGAATVGGSARVLDLGPAWIGMAKAVIETSALVATGTYTVTLQGSTDAVFTTPVTLASTTVVSSAAANRNELPFDNQQADVTYRYVRAFITTGGTSPSINCVIFLAMQ